MNLGSGFRLQLHPAATGYSELFTLPHPHRQVHPGARQQQALVHQHGAFGQGDGGGAGQVLPCLVAACGRVRIFV